MMDDEEYNKYIGEIDENSKLSKEYLINDIIKLRVHSLLPSGSPECTYEGCTLPRDHTMMGWDTSCPYHRLLFDHWMYEVYGTELILELEREEKRRLFREWVGKTGKKGCDSIVDEMSHVPLNWKC